MKTANGPWAVAGLTTAALLALPSLALAAKPELVVNSAHIKGSDFAFRGAGSLDQRVDITIKNKGDKAAKRSVAKIYLVHGRDRYEIATPTVPSIAAHRLEAVDARVKRHNDFPVGGYAVQVCVEAHPGVEESNKKHDCKTLKKEFSRFYSVYRTYEGTASGEGPGHPFEESVRESWDGQDIAFSIQEGRKGVFTYGVANAGSVAYLLSGTTSTGCTHSGAGALQLAGDSVVTVDWRSETYTATAKPSGSYPTSSSCEPDNPGTGPVNGLVFTTGLLGAPMSVPFGSEKLAGTSTDPFDAAGPVRYSWNLVGCDPRC